MSASRKANCANSDTSWLTAWTPIARRVRTTRLISRLPLNPHANVCADGGGMDLRYGVAVRQNVMGVVGNFRGHGDDASANSDPSSTAMDMGFNSK